MRLTSRTLSAALAALLIAAPAAIAKPADTHAGLGESAAAASTQDLRSPDARDAANRSQSPTSSLAGTTSPARDSSPTWTKLIPGPPTWPTDPQPITPAPAATATDDGNRVDWTTIVLGIAGGLLALGGLAAATRRRQRLSTIT